MKILKNCLEVAGFIGWILFGPALIQGFHEELGFVFDGLGCAVIYFLVRVALPAFVKAEGGAST